MRALVTVAALFFALWSVTLTGNAYRVRWYLGAMLAHTLAVEMFPLLGGNLYSDGYYWLYVGTSVPILLAATLIAHKMLLNVRNRHGERWKWVLVPMAVSLAALAFSPLDTRVRFFMAAQGAILACAGMQTLAVALLRGLPPYLTLGGLWLGQALLFFMYAHGLTVNPRNWQVIGEWLPAGLVIFGMVKLAASCLRSTTVEP